MEVRSSAILISRSKTESAGLSSQGTSTLFLISRWNSVTGKFSVYLRRPDKDSPLQGKLLLDAY